MLSSRLLQWNVVKCLPCIPSFLPFLSLMTSPMLSSRLLQRNVVKCLPFTYLNPEYTSEKHPLFLNSEWPYVFLSLSMQSLHVGVCVESVHSLTFSPLEIWDFFSSLSSFFLFSLLCVWFFLCFHGNISNYRNLLSPPNPIPLPIWL